MTSFLFGGPVTYFLHLHQESENFQVTGIWLRLEQEFPNRNHLKQEQMLWKAQQLSQEILKEKINVHHFGLWARQGHR